MMPLHRDWEKSYGDFCSLDEKSWKIDLKFLPVFCCSLFFSFTLPRPLKDNLKFFIFHHGSAEYYTFKGSEYRGKLQETETYLGE